MSPRAIVAIIAGMLPLLLGCGATQPFEPGCSAEDMAKLFSAWLAESEAVCIADGCSDCIIEQCPGLSDVDAGFRERLDAWVACGGAGGAD